MGSRGSEFERRENPKDNPFDDDEWWKQQDADKVAEERRRQREEEQKQKQQGGAHIEHIVGPDGTGYLVDTDTGEMWRDTEPQPSKNPKEPEQERTEPEKQPEGTNPDPYSQERKDNALWTTDKKTVDGILRKSSGELYKTFDKETKDAFESYTASGFRNINSALAHGNKGSAYTAKRIDKMTSALEKAELPVDIWLQRGIETDVAENMFKGDVSLSGIQKMIDAGDIIDNKPFMSTAAAKGSGFTSKPVILNIYAPKGTKGIYAEPFAALGGGSPSWDGESPSIYLSGEFEVILQRGAQLRPLKTTEKNGKIYVDLQVEGFKYE